MSSHCRFPGTAYRAVAVVIGLAVLSCRPETTELKETPYKAAAERFGEAYCALAFSEGCSVPEDCGLPAGFDDRADCRFRLVPFLRGCAVPEDRSDSVIVDLDACLEAMAATSCDTSLCGGGTLDTDPCISAFEHLASHCAFEGL